MLDTLIPNIRRWKLSQASILQLHKCDNSCAMLRATVEKCLKVANKETAAKESKQTVNPRLFCLHSIYVTECGCLATLFIATLD